MFSELLYFEETKQYRLLEVEDPESSALESDVQE